jgi:hypothetical protein
LHSPWFRFRKEMQAMESEEDAQHFTFSTDALTP